MRIESNAFRQHGVCKINFRTGYAIDVDYDGINKRRVARRVAIRFANGASIAQSARDFRHEYQPSHDGVGQPLKGNKPNPAGNLVSVQIESGKQKSRGIEGAYRVSQGIQALLNSIREQIRDEHAAALKREETRYRHTTDGGWLSEREDYYKALTESVYRERRSRLIETLFLWWADVLRAKVAKVERLLESCAQATEKLAGQLNTAAVLKRVRRLEEMRDQLNTNAQEALVLEVGCLHIFR